MALHAFWWVAENIKKMNPPDPPPPYIWKIPYVFCRYFLKASLNKISLKISWETHQYLVLPPPLAKHSLILLGMDRAKVLQRSSVTSSLHSLLMWRISLSLVLQSRSHSLSLIIPQMFSIELRSRLFPAQATTVILLSQRTAWLASDWWHGALS